MPAVDVQSNVPGSSPDGQIEPTCATCSHPWDAHDPIAKRFCAATEAGGTPRRCLCSGISSGMTYSNSTKSPLGT